MSEKLTIDDLYFIRGALLQTIDNRKETIRNKNITPDTLRIAREGLYSYQQALSKIVCLIGDNNPTWRNQCLKHSKQ